MIKIRKNQQLNVVLTLNEKTTLSNPFYIFEVSNKFHRVVFSATDTSMFKRRYNQFTFIEGTTFTLPNGQYNYTAYETALEGDLNVDNATGIVEQGIMVIEGLESATSFDGVITFNSYD